MNFIYDSGRNAFATGDIKWRAIGGDTIKAFLINTSNYTANKSHSTLSDIPESARIGNDGMGVIIKAAELTLLPPVSGICDAEDITFTGIPSGENIGAMVLFKDGGSDADSQLITYMDSGVGVPFSTNGGDLIVQWNNGPNKIFKL